MARFGVRLSLPHQITAFTPTRKNARSCALASVKREIMHRLAPTRLWRFSPC
jgi:hypothetical protein